MKFNDSPDCEDIPRFMRQLEAQMTALLFSAVLNQDSEISRDQGLEWIKHG
jgi:hypothetical protein